MVAETGEVDGPAFGDHADDPAGEGGSGLDRPETAVEFGELRLGAGVVRDGQPDPVAQRRPRCPAGRRGVGFQPEHHPFARQFGGPLLGERRQAGPRRDPYSPARRGPFGDERDGEVLVAAQAETAAAVGRVDRRLEDADQVAPTPAADEVGPEGVDAAGGGVDRQMPRTLTAARDLAWSAAHREPAGVRRRGVVSEVEELSAVPGVG